MKQVTVFAMLVIALAAVAGCSSDSGDPGASGRVSFSVLVGDEDVTAVTFDISCDSGLKLSGEFNVNDEQDPPIWATVMDLPVGDCSVTLTALGENGEALCSGSEDFTVIANETVKVNVVLVCEGDGGEELLGNVDIDATFIFVDGNACPRLHFLNAVPDEVPPEGSKVTVLVSDKDGDILSTALSATDGSFADPSAQSTIYTCDNAAGAQTISVTVSDGDPSCDKSKSFDVTCPGTNLCENVICDDDGNPCTDVACNPANGECETSNNSNECTTGGGGELSMNGGFETGNLDGWTLFCDGLGTCEATTAEARTGAWSGRVATSGAPANPLIKQANKGIGVVQPNSEITIRFSLKGSLSGASGVVFAELFSEIVPEGVSKAEFLGGGPLFPTDQWVDYEFTTTTGPDVSNGITLQLAAICGAVEGCAVEAFFDDVSIEIAGGAGEPGICREGVCVPSAECSTADDCPDTGNECTDAVCDAGVCGISNNTNVCDGGAGTCSEGVCVPDAECTVAADCPDTGNECTDAVCDAGVCGVSNNTDVCDGGAGTCSEGTCVPNAEVVYEQNFETLGVADPGALSGDGWLYFGAVFNADESPKFNFGPFPAPNGPQIVAIATGQGGPAQGEQQLNMYSNYECCQDAGPEGHFAGDELVQTIVFQELVIPASYIGKTFVFSFDGKRGNINDPSGSSTAQAFINTIAANGDLTNNKFLDATNLSPDWTRYTVELDLTDPLLQGQKLQFGYATIAKNFEPSANFYDNILSSLE